MHFYIVSGILENITVRENCPCRVLGFFQGRNTMQRITYDYKSFTHWIDICY